MPRLKRELVGCSTTTSVVMFLGLGKEPSERELEREGRLLLINDEEKEGGQDATSEPYGGLSFYKIGIKIVQVGFTPSYLHASPREFN